MLDGGLTPWGGNPNLAQMEWKTILEKKRAGFSLSADRIPLIFCISNKCDKAYFVVFSIRYSYIIFWSHLAWNLIISCIVDSKMPFWCGLKPLTALPLLCRACCAAAVGRAADGRRTHRVTVVGSVADGRRTMRFVPWSSIHAGLFHCTKAPWARRIWGWIPVPAPPKLGGRGSEPPYSHPLSQGDGGLNRCPFPSVPCILVLISSQNILITGYGRTAYARTFLMIGNLHSCLSAPQEDNYGHAVEPKRWYKM